MKNIWLKFGCFITGYNYNILRNSSEASIKTVKKYLSAILIISIIWGFIGFVFSKRYLHAGLWGSAIVTVVLVFIVIQIERQIILSTGKNRFALVFRVIIGIVMALIGSVIIDQVIFKDDIEKQKISDIQEEVNQVLDFKTQELGEQLIALNNAIELKENERSEIIDELAKKPFVKSMKSETKNQIRQVFDSSGTVRDTVIKTTDYTLTDISNPKGELIPQIASQIQKLQELRTEKENNKINIRGELEEEMKSKTGFLEELAVLFSILLSSPISLIVWSLIFIFFLALELFVLVNKFGDRGTDYDEVILHQMRMHLLKLNQLSNGNGSVRQVLQY